MIALARWAGWFPALALALLAGCASAPPAPPPAAANGPWSGRLALQVKDNPSQSFSAMFELRGTARAGELALSTPVGSTLAVLAWEPGVATLRSNGRTRESESIDALVAQVAGSSIPVAALFDWLRGMPTEVPGWRPNLSQLAQGRLSAERLQPPPQADLHVVLDR
jgi:outer membrane lipoprotein LolB